LLAKGFSPTQLFATGFTLDSLKDAGVAEASLDALRRSGSNENGKGSEGTAAALVVLGLVLVAVTVAIVLRQRKGASMDTAGFDEYQQAEDRRNTHQMEMNPLHARRTTDHQPTAHGNNSNGALVVSTINDADYGPHTTAVENEAVNVTDVTGEMHIPAIVSTANVAEYSEPAALLSAAQLYATTESSTDVAEYSEPAALLSAAQLYAPGNGGGTSHAASGGATSCINSNDQQQRPQQPQQHREHERQPTYRPTDDDANVYQNVDANVGRGGDGTMQPKLLHGGGKERRSKPPRYTNMDTILQQQLTMTADDDNGRDYVNAGALDGVVGVVGGPPDRGADHDYINASQSLA
jgi:hypothetical protein